MTASDNRCDSCQIGYHDPFDRFETLAAISDGPAFLKRCGDCGTLWVEKLHSVGQVDREEALRQFPAWTVRP
jgi:hypothetical protein